MDKINTEILNVNNDVRVGLFNCRCNQIYNQFFLNILSTKQKNNFIEQNGKKVTCSYILINEAGGKFK